MLCSDLSPYALSSAQPFSYALSPMVFMRCLPNRCFSLPWLALRRSSLFFSSRPIALCSDLIYPTLLWCTALLCATLIYPALLYYTSTSAATPASTSTSTYNIYIYIYTHPTLLSTIYMMPPSSLLCAALAKFALLCPSPPPACAAVLYSFRFCSAILYTAPTNSYCGRPGAAQRCSSLLYQTLLYFALCLLYSTLPYSTLRNSTELYSAVYYL